jgi:mannose-6-phosphate isomerase-like protein (cupin superfamily)
VNLVVSTDLDGDWRELFEGLADVFAADSANVRHRSRPPDVLAPQFQSVVRYLPAALARAPAATAAVSASLTALQGALHWRQNANYTDSHFLRGYGYCELLGPAGHWRSDRLSLGLLLLAPRLTYPEHVHPATEIYVVLSGHAQWQQGDRPWQERPPASVITHASLEPHTMRTGAEPLLAAYLWRDHLDEPARLLERTGDECR